MAGNWEEPETRGRADQQSKDGVASQIMGMAAALWASHQRNKIVMLLVALVGVVGATAYMQIRLNAWNQPFYDALAHRDVSAFVDAARRLCGAGGHIARSQRRASVAQSEVEAASCARVSSKTSRRSGSRR